MSDTRDLNRDQGEPEIYTPDKTALIPKQASLFPNEISLEHFGITRLFADGFSKTIKEITPDKAKEGYKLHGKTFKFKTKDTNIETSIRIIDRDERITDADQFSKELLKLKDAKTIKTLEGLWAYANQQGSFHFKGVRISDILETMGYKKPKKGYTQGQRKELTTIINFLRDIEITLDREIKDKNERTGRVKSFIKSEYFKFIDLYGTTHAKRIKDIKDDKGNIIYNKGDKDESVIIRLFGELLPRLNKGIMRGRLYSKGLLQLDANRDNKAIVLGFWLATRFDQLRGAGGADKGKQKPESFIVLRTDRGELIERADYTKTDKENKSRASGFLKNTLDKLIEAKILSRYDPKEITTDDSQKITLYPTGAGTAPLLTEPETDGGLNL